MTSADTTVGAVHRTGVYTCPMHPSIRKPEPGACPICGMTLSVIAKRRAAFGPFSAATLASFAMLGVYFGVLSLVSGWSFTLSEFARFWPFVLALAFGFGTQIGLYTYLKQVLAQHHAGKMVVASGTTSTAAMISCCAHYLANVAPVLGAAGFVTLVAQYQVELFWVGLAFNAAGIAFIGSKILRARRQPC